MTTISIVIPIYNKREKFQGTIQSILNQTYKEFEVIILDDSSTDDSLSAPEVVTDSRITIYHKNHRGVSRARNLGIEKANGQFIVFIDADDEWHTDYLQSMISWTSSYPDCSIFVSNYKFKDNHEHEFIVKFAI